MQREWGRHGNEKKIMPRMMRDGTGKVEEKYAKEVVEQAHSGK